MTVSIAKTATDLANLDTVLALVRQHCPFAVAVKLETSDQGLYGFVLTGVTEESKSTGLRFDRLPEDALPAEVCDRIMDLLCDIDWNGVVYEDRHGYASYPLPTGNYVANFQPEMWLNDHAVPVESELIEWDCTAMVSARPAYFTDAFRTHVGFLERGVVDADDVLKGDPAAPQIVREWSGPFTIRVRRVRRADAVQS